MDMLRVTDRVTDVIFTEQLTFAFPYSHSLVSLVIWWRQRQLFPTPTMARLTAPAVDVGARPKTRTPYPTVDIQVQVDMLYGCLDDSVNLLMDLPIQLQAQRTGMRPETLELSQGYWQVAVAN